MHREDLMNADMLSEILLLVSGTDDFGHVIADPGGRAYANRGTDIERLSPCSESVKTVDAF